MTAVQRILQPAFQAYVSQAASGSGHFNAKSTGSRLSAKDAPDYFVRSVQVQANNSGYASKILGHC